MPTVNKTRMISDDYLLLKLQSEHSRLENGTEEFSQACYFAFTVEGKCEGKSLDLKTSHMPFTTILQRGAFRKNCLPYQAWAVLVQVFPGHSH